MKTNLIVFRLSGNTYAFQLEKIPLVIGLEKLTFMVDDMNVIPDTVNYLLEEIKIFNLHKLLNLDAKPIQKTSKLLVGEHGNLTVGCFVDKVVSIMKIDENDFIETEETRNEKFVAGILSVDNTVKFLDIDKIYKSEVVLKSIKS